MRIIALKTLRLFWEQHPDARQALQAWHHDARQATWKNPLDIKKVYRNASVVGRNRVVFNIKGNRYRLVVAVQYRHGIVYIRFAGSHKAYYAVRKKGDTTINPDRTVRGRVRRGAAARPSR